MSRTLSAVLPLVALVGLLGSWAPGQAADARPRTAVTATVTADGAPVVTDDTVTITQEPQDVDVHVLADDSDPDGDNLQICRVEAPDDTGLSVHIWSDHGEPGWGPQPSGSSYLMIEARTALPLGPLSVTYYACDQQLLTPGTLTVDVVRITARPVVGSPGVVRWTNPLDQKIDVVYGKPGAENADGSFSLAPGATKDRAVHRTKLVWLAFPHDVSGEGDDPFPLAIGHVHDTGYRGRTGPQPFSATRERARWRMRSLPLPTAPYDAVAAPTRTDGADLGTDPVDAPPVAADDHVVVDYDDSVEVPVLANDSDDSDDSADDLAVCRVDVPVDQGLGVVIEPWWGGSDRARSDDPHRYLALDVNAARGGTYHLTYWACDKHSLTPATLTVTVRRFPPPRVRRIAGKPGTVDFYNGGYRAVHVQYSDQHPDSRTSHLAVPAHAHRRVHVAYDTLDYFASSSIGPLGFFRVRHVQQRG